MEGVDGSGDSFVRCWEHFSKSQRTMNFRLGSYRASVFLGQAKVMANGEGTGFRHRFLRGLVLFLQRKCWIRKREG